MEANQLQRGQYFRLPKQRKYRHCLSVSTLPNSTNIGENDRGKLLICFDNCKQMVVPGDCTVEAIEKESVMGMSNQTYSTSFQRYTVVLGKFKTEISHLLKDGRALLYVYTIKNIKSEWMPIDCRELNEFPKVDFEVMQRNGLYVLAQFLNKSQKNPMLFLQNN